MIDGLYDTCGSTGFTPVNEAPHVPLTSVTNPNGQSTSYTYQDSTGTGEPRLAEIKNLNSLSAVISKFDYGYDAQGQITSWTQQTDSNDPQNWAMQYDNEGKLLDVNVTDTVTSSVLHQYAYLYDAAGNRTSEQIDGSVVGSSYNNLNQLTGQSGGGKMVFSGTLSEPAVVTVAGQPATSSYYRTNFYGIAPVTTGTNTVAVVAHDVNGNYGTNNYQVVVPPASSGYSYDLNGNLLTDGTRTFQWDAENQMTAIIYNSGPNAGNHTELTYNGAGQRVKIVEATGTTVGSGTVTSTKQFVWAGGLAEEHDVNNNVTKRFFAQGEQISGTNYFYTTDHLGSIREMMASDGKTTATRYSYDPYGRRTKVSGSIDSDFGFTGHYWHVNSGLYLAPYRAYDPNLGRWLSRDPIGEAGGPNLYAYCANNPVNQTDPFGLCDEADQRKEDLLNALKKGLLLKDLLEASEALNADDPPGEIATIVAQSILTDLGIDAGDSALTQLNQAATNAMNNALQSAMNNQNSTNPNPDYGAAINAAEDGDGGIGDPSNIYFQTMGLGQ